MHGSMRRLLRRSALAAAASLAALLAAGCVFTTDPGSGPTQVAGGTIETTNGVIMSGTRPAARIKVFLVDERSWLSNVKDGKPVLVDSFETDDTGHVVIKRDTAAKVSLMANAEGHGVLIRGYNATVMAKDYRGVITMKAHASYRGQVGAGETGARRIYLAGTPFSAPIDDKGAFEIPGVPPERYQVVIKRVGPSLEEEFVPAGEVDLTKPDTGGAKPDTLKPDTSKSVLFEDFEDGDSETKLGQLEGTSYWDVNSDAHLDGNARLLTPPTATPTHIMDAIQDAGAAGRGQAIEVVYQMGSKPNYWKPFSMVHLFASIGPNGKQYGHYNLSKMDTLSFWAKGDGRLVVGFIQGIIGVHLEVLADATVTLTDQWQHFKIASKDLQITTVKFPATPAQSAAELEAAGLPAYTKKPETFAETGGKFRGVEIMGTGGTTFWIDDIRFQGMALDDLVKK